MLIPGSVPVSGTAPVRLDSSPRAGAPGVTSSGRQIWFGHTAPRKKIRRRSRVPGIDDAGGGRLLAAGSRPAVATADLVASGEAREREAVRELLVRSLVSAPDVVLLVCRELLDDLDGFEFRGEVPFRP